VWVFTNSGGVWTQQGAKLVGTGATETLNQGYSVALSADGNTAMVGGPGGSNSGAAWVYTRSSGVWTQQGSKLIGTGAVGTNVEQGYSVALSADGNTAIMGGYQDNSYAGAAWAFTRSGSVWTQRGSKLVGTGTVGASEQGSSVALSADGYTAFVGGPNDNGQVGAAWVFVQPALQVTPATNIVAAGNPGGPFTPASFQYQLSATVGSFNYSISGVPSWLTPSVTVGNTSSATPVTFTVNANSLTPGTYTATITFTNTDTGQGTQTRTATLTVNSLGLQVAPTTGIVASGMQGGPFSPSSFSYTLSATSASTKYTITNVPSWLTASSTSGTLTTAAKTITFKIASGAANKLTPSLYLGNINFNDTTNSQGNTTLIASLTVAPKDYTIKVSTSPSADGTVSGGGTFVSGTSQTVTATPNSGHSFVHWTKGGSVVSTSESYTFTLTANVTLVADFK
jgi:Divergent InlB B-repeat domain